MRSIADAIRPAPGERSGSAALRLAGVSRLAAGDQLFVLIAALHGLVLVASPTIPLIAIGLWWHANTISHNFIHRPFFRARLLNQVFSAYSTLLLGIPQRLWRDRHLAHHAGAMWRLTYSPQLAAELILVATLWGTLAAIAPAFLASVYLPGWVIGLRLCLLQGHYEHAGATTSYYGRIYNFFCFNDGYHVEHHASPGLHWRALAAHRTAAAHSSRWPPLLRWIDDVNALSRVHVANRVTLANLEWLESLVLHFPTLQRFVLRAHRRAFAPLLASLPPLHRVAIVGGGLFPRTALIVRELAPDATLLVIDSSASHVATARLFIDDRVSYEVRHYVAPDPVANNVDLVVIPLAFEGDRAAVYRRPPAKAVLVHDWIWHRAAESAIVSPLLLKRVNLVRQ